MTTTTTVLSAEAMTLLKKIEEAEKKFAKEMADYYRYKTVDRPCYDDRALSDFYRQVRKDAGL